MLQLTKTLFGIAVLIAISITACASSPTTGPSTQPMSGTPMSPEPAAIGESKQIPSVPPVKGYADEQEIFFIHTEASDSQVANTLTGMMRSPVLVVPSLAQAPDTMLANVYVFTNGIKGGGPMGFQPDVFDRPPRDPGYTPLRALNLVTWKDERVARELKSVNEIKSAEARGEITIVRPGVVINMPFLIWQGGQR
ncbi:MAG: hypothetical protein HY070_00255 [Chloroflexi bacterium]|nr:hypothetical protein [Chloroflexota bacterium]